MNKIKFANTDVDAWKVRAGTVVVWEGQYYHVCGFASNDVLNINDDISLQTSIRVGADELWWIEPH